MTEQQHPITPPPELVKQWVTEVWHEGTPARLSLSDMHIATEAARWAADEQLKKCHQWVADNISVPEAHELSAAMRPKSLSEKEQALDLLDRIEQGVLPWALSELNVIRRVLKAVPGD